MLTPSTKILVVRKQIKYLQHGDEYVEVWMKISWVINERECDRGWKKMFNGGNVDDSLKGFLNGLTMRRVSVDFREELMELKRVYERDLGENKEHLADITHTLVCYMRCFVKAYDASEELKGKLSALEMKCKEGGDDE